MFREYELKNNEKLNDIANTFGTRVEVLKDLNSLIDLDNLKYGDIITIPEKTIDYYNYYTVSKGDNIYAISKKLNINPELLMAINGLDKDDYIYQEQQLILPKKGYSYYITKEGDTIDEVIKIFDSDKEKFMKENETVYLMSGQLLVNKK